MLIGDMDIEQGNESNEIRIPIKRHSADTDGAKNDELYNITEESLPSSNMNQRIKEKKGILNTSP